MHLSKCQDPAAGVGILETLQLPLFWIDADAELDWDQCSFKVFSSLARANNNVVSKLI